MRRWLGMLWCTTVLPFSILPWVTIAREQPAPWYSSHAFFHIVYLPIIAATIYVAARLAAETPRRATRVLASLLVVAHVAAFAGHAGELISVSRHGGFDAGEDVFDTTLHSISELFALPGLLIGIVLVVVMTVVVATEDRRSRRAAPAELTESSP